MSGYRLKKVVQDEKERTRTREAQLRTKLKQKLRRQTREDGREKLSKDPLSFPIEASIVDPLDFDVDDMLRMSLARDSVRVPAGEAEKVQQVHPGGVSTSFPLFLNSTIFCASDQQASLYIFKILGSTMHS